MQRVSTLYLLRYLLDPEAPVAAFRGHIECYRSSPGLGREKCCLEDSPVKEQRWWILKDLVVGLGRFHKSTTRD